MAYGNNPISSTNVETVIGIEAVPGVVATSGKNVAYLQNGLVPNQTMEKDVSLRGNRQMGTRVPGMKNPGGPLALHENDLLLPLSWYAIMGKLATTTKLQTAPTLALLPATAGLVDSGTHSYKRVITRPGGTAESAASASITTDTATHGKTTVSFGALPVGWTSALYRTAAGNALVGPWTLVPGASALAANVTSFVDNVADASLLGAYPAITNNDFQHVITPAGPADFLPALTVQKKFPYIGGAAAYFQSLGCSVNKATMKMIGAGFYDISHDFLNFDYVGPLDTSFDPLAVDWRGGEKIHHAMMLAGDVLLDGVAFAKFIDATITYMNNLDTSDHPLGAGGGLGSLAPQQAEVDFAATVKVTDPTVVELASDVTVLHEVSIKHSFVTPGHYIQHDVFGISFDPTAPTPSGQGILKLSANGIASQPDGGDEFVVTIVNDQPNSIYTT